MWLYAAHNPHLKAAVAWYGPVGGDAVPIQPKTAPTSRPTSTARCWACTAPRTRASPRPTCEAAAAKARAAGKTVEIVVFPDAGHGFHADYRPTYVPDAAADGWDRMLAWFRKYGVA